MLNLAIGFAIGVVVAAVSPWVYAKGVAVADWIKSKIGAAY